MALELIALPRKKYLLLVRVFFAHKTTQATAMAPLSRSRGRHGRHRRYRGSAAPPLPRLMVGEGGAVEPPRQTTSMAASSTALARPSADAHNPRPQQRRGRAADVRNGR